MDRVLYLLSVSVSGIKSIKEEVRLSFYKKTVDRDFNPEQYRIKAIYGENGSGKSAIITAIKICQDIILNDNYLNESKTQSVLHEIINKSTKKLRVSFEYLVILENEKTVYNYMIEVGQNVSGLYQIEYETLRMKNGNYSNNNYKVIYESKNGELTQMYYDGNDRKDIEKKAINLLSTHSFSYIYIMNLDKDKSILNYFFIHNVYLITFFAVLKIYIAEEDQHELYFFRKRMEANSMNTNAWGEAWQEFNHNLNKISSVNEKQVRKEHFNKYREKVEQLTEFIKIFKRNLVSIDIDAKENGEYYECDLNLNYGEYSINKEFESTGIKKLIRLFDCFVSASEGGIVFIDEMDSNLNDVYLCKIIEYFMYYGKGQLCFTTHNLDPMSVLKENKNSIDFLSSDNHLVSWTARGNATPENCYKNGMIEDSPFNIDAVDFVGIFGE